MDEEPDLLVILNDNRMSISEAVGGLTRMLGRMTGSKTLNAIREGGKKILGDKRSSGPARFVRRWEEHWKGMFVPSTLFEEMGFHYTGPIDGHDVDALAKTLGMLKTLKGPQLLHVITTKGRVTNSPKATRSATTRYRRSIRKKAWCRNRARRSRRPTPTSSATGCATWPRPTRSCSASPRRCAKARAVVRFSKEYPDRYFDVAIAEQHAVTLAAGMACEGAKPVVAIYSTFLQRAYDQLVHDVAIQDLDVLFAIDRGGVVGPDGATHAGNLDLSYLRCVPNMLVMAPADENECRQMLSTGFEHQGPAAVRYPRGSGPGVAVSPSLDTLPIGKAELRRRGSRIALLAFGAIVPAAQQVGEELGLTVVNMRFVKPLDRALVLELAKTHEGFVTLEDNVVAGGAGSGVAELLAAENIAMPILHLGLPDAFQHHASREDLLAEAGLDAAGIRASLLNRWPELSQNNRHAARPADNRFFRKKSPREAGFDLVGVAGFEPTTTCPPDKCATRLRYTPVRELYPAGASHRFRSERTSSISIRTCLTICVDSVDSCFAPSPSSRRRAPPMV